MKANKKPNHNHKVVGFGTRADIPAFFHYGKARIMKKK